jgi:hypothetical protein
MSSVVWTNRQRSFSVLAAIVVSIVYWTPWPAAGGASKGAEELGDGEVDEEHAASKHGRMKIESLGVIMTLVLPSVRE